MRAVGVSPARNRLQLQRWLDLSVNKNVPGSLLIMSQVRTVCDPTLPYQACRCCC